MLARRAVRIRPELIAIILIAAVTIAAFLNALHLASHLAQTSDTAQGLVVGHAIANGNILLSQWHFPIDNFYFTDSLPYAAAETVVGPRPYLMAVIPALVYAGLVLLALILCIRPLQSPNKYTEALALTVVLLGVPLWIGAWNPMLMSDMHTATVLAGLAGLALLAHFATAQSSNVGPLVAPLAFLSVALAVASDPFSLFFAFGPAAAVLAVEAVRKKDAPKVRFALVLLAAAITAGLLLPRVVAQIGGFTTENDVTFHFATLRRWWPNLVSVVLGVMTLWGTNPLNVASIAGGLIFAIRCAALAAVLFVALRLVHERLRGRKTALLDRLLCAGAAASLLACIPSAQFAKGVKPETIWIGGPPMRFLVPAVLFASIVAGRQVVGTLDTLANATLRVRLHGALLALAGFALLAGIAQLLEVRARPWLEQNPATGAARWLQHHRLSQGAGEYWAANLVTAMSGTAVGVRSMVPDHGHLVPYVWAETRTVYARLPQFAIWQEPNQAGVTEAMVRATWPVCATRIVAGYHIALLQTSAKFATCRSP